MAGIRFAFLVFAIVSIAYGLYSNHYDEASAMTGATIGSVVGYFVARTRAIGGKTASTLSGGLTGGVCGGLSAVMLTSSPSSAELIGRSLGDLVFALPFAYWGSKVGCRVPAVSESDLIKASLTAKTDTDERTNQLIGELRGLGVAIPVDLDERTCRLVRQLGAEKAAQLEGAKAVISPLVFLIVVAVFALCFWRYDIGVVFSVGAAILAIPVIWLGVSLPIGYVLGSRAARRFKARLHEEGGAH